MKPIFLFVFLLPVLSGFFAPAPAGAQEALSSALISREDSTRLLRAARADQAQFERIRRSRLPEGWSGGSSHCDERVGRFCLTHGRGRSDWVAPPEHEDVIRARNNLLDGLARVAEILPGDGWITGQRVRYLVEARRLDEALGAARQCRAERSWCAALAGFALHHSSRGVEADSAYAVALESMAEDERERWLDITQILDDRSVRIYRRMQPDEQEEFELNFWRLADPLFTRPGNELWSEHLTRHVWDQLQFRAQSPDGISWGYDLREILIRYGWPSGYERVRDNWRLTAGPPSLISHYGGAPQDLLPPTEALLEEKGTSGEWDVEDPRSRTGYSLPYQDSVARWFTPLAHQVAVFRRPGEAIVVAAYELPRDSVPDDANVAAGLALLSTLDRGAPPDTVMMDSAGVSDALMIRGAAEPMVMSLEVFVPSERRMARSRYGLDLSPIAPGLLGISDLLLVHADETLPDSLEQAIELARGSSQVSAGQQVGLFWEVYGVDATRTSELTLSLRLLEGRTGWLRRLAERAGLLREVAPIRLRWEEAVTPGPYMPRSLAIQIPEVSPGTYTLELEVEAPGREALTVRKDIEVMR